MINISKVILLPVALLVIFLQPLLSVKASDDAQAEQIIQDYIDYLELDIQPGTLDY